MILRRREKRTLDALEDLVRVPRRRARRAQGDHHDHRWLAPVSRRNGALARPIDGQVPTGPTIGVDPRDGHARQPRADLFNGRHRNRRLRTRPVRAVAARRRAAVPRHAGRGEPRERVLLSRSIRAASPCSTRTSFPRPASASARTRIRPCRRPRIGRASSLAIRRFARSRKRPTASPSLDNNDLSRGLRRITDDLSSYLPARLLLHREARRPVPLHQRSRQASRRPGARAARVSCEHRGRRRRGGAGCCSRGCPRMRARFDAAARVAEHRRARTSDAPARDRRMDARERSDRVGRRRGQTRSAGRLGRRRTGRRHAR